MRRPRVSVLLPCRDVVPYLHECIASLEEQTLSDFEVLAVDDRSADGTGQVLEEWACRDSRVRVLRTGKAGEGGEGGLVSALELATEEARAPLLARMDADDAADPRRLELQVQFMSDRRELAACGARVELFPAKNVGSGYARYSTWLNALTGSADLERDLFVECPIAHPTLMIRASALRGIGGYREMGWPEDYDLVLRLHAAGMAAANLPITLHRWRVRPDRHSLASQRYSPAAFRRCKVHFLAACFVPPDRPVAIWGAGRVGKPLAREMLRQGMTVHAFVDLDPRKIGQEIHGAPVFDPTTFTGAFAGKPPYILGAVGSPGARHDIRLSLDALGFRELADYRMCA